MPNYSSFSPDSLRPHRLAVLGSTGTIGRKVLSTVEEFPERFRVKALFAWRNVTRLAEQVRQFQPGIVGIGDETAAGGFDRSVLPPGAELRVGQGVAEAIAAGSATDVVVNAIVGSAGLKPTLAAVDRGARVALANKESIVLAGGLIMPRAREKGATLIPIDSEHSGLFQCLHNRDKSEVRRLILTASGGPFRNSTREELERVTPAQALRHPVWPMGPRITIDSATLMNKGLEVLEAACLFDQPLHAIDVVVHPQSIVHALVELVDGSIIAQLGHPDMRLPVQYALSWPDRWSTTLPRVDLAMTAALDFEPPDIRRFPCLELAYQAGRAGGLAPTVLNAADEVAVAAFREGRIRFVDIPGLIEEALTTTPSGPASDIDTILAVDAETRRTTGAATIRRSPTA